MKKYYDEKDEQVEPRLVTLVRKWMMLSLREMKTCTQLAEEAAIEFDLCADDEQATIPEWVFDLAVDVQPEEETSEEVDEDEE